VLGSAALAPLGLACRGTARQRRGGRGILLLVVDALRYDHTSFGRAGWDTTPRLAAWAQREGVVLDDLWSAAPSLVPAHVALLTGCDPLIASTPRVVLSDGRTVEPLTPWTIPRGAPSLAVELLQAGWTTAAFIDHRFPMLRGLERGFVVFESFGGGGKSARLESGLAGVCERFLDWLAGLDAEQDWFAYLHLNDLEVVWDEAEWSRSHPELAPREPRPELDFVPPIGATAPLFHALPPQRVLRDQPSLGAYEARYHAALAWMDGNLVRLFGMMADQGRMERTSVAVTGSFGLSFGESGLLVSSGTPCDVDLHVPCVLRPAPELRMVPGARVGALASSLDLCPTLLQMAEVPEPAGLHGRSLVPLLRGREAAVRSWACASHGDIDGFCAVDETRVYTVLRLGGRKSSLAASFYGDERRAAPAEERFLVPRRPDGGGPGRGLPLPPAGLADLAPDLHQAALDWYGDLERAREVLHPSAWNADKRTESVVAELRQKGLIGG